MPSQDSSPAWHKVRFQYRKNKLTKGGRLKNSLEGKPDIYEKVTVLVLPNIWYNVT